MDAFARGLLAAHRILEDGMLDTILEERYASFREGMGKQIMSGRETFDSLEKWINGKGGA